MPNLLQTLEENFQPNLEEFASIQKLALESFKNLGFPDTKHEEWKYSNIKNLVEKNYTLKESTVDEQLDSYKNSKINNLEGIHLYFVNGIFIESGGINELPKGLKVVNINATNKEEKEELKQYFEKIIKEENEAFSTLNTAFTKDGVFILVSKNTQIEQAIICHFLADVEDADQICHLKNIMVFEENSEAKIIENYYSFGQNSSFTNAVSEIHVSKNARVDYYKIQDETNKSSHIGTTQVYQKDGSNFYSATFSFNAEFIRNNLNILLEGENIEAHMFGLYLPTGEQHVDNHTLVDHKKPNCESNELYKGILMDKSTGVFNGKIFVRQDAQNTNAYQNCRNVITSDTATMNTKPQLEIWADAVKCSHGTTTGKLDDEVIFYLQSRGIPKAEAIRMQLLAFAEDVISKIKIENLKEYLAEKASQKLSSSI